MSQLIVCLDFDGTLADKDGRIHPNDVTLLENPGDVLFIVATGRPLHSLRYSFNDAGLFRGREIPLPLVLQNGALTFFRDEVVCEFKPFPLALQRELVAYARDHGHIPFFFSGFETFELMHPTPTAERHAERFRLNVFPFHPGDVQQPFIKMMAVSDDNEALAAMVAGLTRLLVEPVFSLPWVVEVSLAGVNKGLATRRLVERMGLGDAQLFVIGDGENDRDLFAIADRVFVPSDAPPTIRTLADAIIDRSPEGILAPVIRAFTEG